MDVKFEVAVVPDCPHTQAAETMFRAALQHVGLPDAVVKVVIVDDEVAATERVFVGSPSFFVNGQDLFPVPAATPAVACRVYRDAEGTRSSGLPDERGLRAALVAALD